MRIGITASLAVFALTHLAWAQNEPKTADEEPMGELSGGVSAAAPDVPALPPAAPPRERSFGGQRNLGPFAMINPGDGFGLGVRVGGARIGFDAALGALPLLVTFSRTSKDSPEFSVVSSFQGNLTGYLGLYRASFRTDMGLALGYKYNDVLGHGVSLAYYLQYDLAKHWALHLFAGPAIFPEADRGLRQRAGYPERGGTLLSGLAAFQGGVGASLVYFP